MYLQTLGHASLLISDTWKKPILLTDPWITGSNYWRSWWLQNYPSKSLIESLKNIPFVYITHEHPDHFHTPSLRKFKKNTQLLFPDLPQRGFEDYVIKEDYNYTTLDILKWKEIAPDFNILSIPLWNDDSILLIDTKTTFIININDAKPSKIILNWIRKLSKVNNKRTVLLSSYSPASIVNSFRKSGKELSIKSKEDYVNYISSVCNTLNVEYFIPFASQVIFRREDSKWANQHKVTYHDLKKFWKSKTNLLHPYSTINLNKWDIKYIKEINYNPPSDKSKKIAINKEIEERNETLTDEEIYKLILKLKKFKFVFRLLFPNGLGLKLDKTNYSINWKDKALVKNGIDNRVDFTIDVPTGALKDAINFNHIGDLGITMFTIIHLSENTKLSPKRIYIFLMLLTLDDYNHTSNFINFSKWVKVNIGILSKLLFFPIPKLTKIS